MSKQVVFVNTIDFSADEKPMPMGILSLASILKNENVSVGIIDFDYLFRIGSMDHKSTLGANIDQMIEHILRLEPKVVSFYTMCNSYPVMLELASELKKRAEKIKIVLGGPQASVTAKETLEAFRYVDVIGIGEGETYITEMINRLLSDQSLIDLRGVAYREGHHIIFNEEAELIKNLDDLPMIDYSLRYEENIKEEIAIEVGRGCPFNCTFCSTSLFWKRNCRLKSVDRIIEEIKHLKNAYGVESFLLNHDMFTASKGYIVKFCNEIINQKLDVKWKCSARIDTIDREIIEYMSASGCKEIYFGIETGSVRMQKKVSKNLKLEKVIENLELLTSFKIKPTLSFIYGFYDEREQDFEETIGIIERLMRNGFTNIQLHKFTALAGTLEFAKVADSLFYDEMSSDISSSPHAGELEQLITDHKNIFSSFHNFDTVVRTKFDMMEFYIRVLTFGFNYYKKTFNGFVFENRSILESYDELNDIIQYYFMQGRVSSTGQQLSHYEYVEVCSECIEKIMDRILETNNCDRYKNVYTFEKDLFRFSLCKDKTEIEKQYPIDVLKALNGKTSSGEIERQNTVISLRKLSNSKIRAKKIKCSKVI